MTLTLLWAEYKAEHPTGYSYHQFREYYCRYKSKLALVMRQIHRPGEKAFSDFSGDGFEYIQGVTAIMVPDNLLDEAGLGRSICRSVLVTVFVTVFVMGLSCSLFL